MFVLTMAVHAEEGRCADKIHAVCACDHAVQFYSACLSSYKTSLLLCLMSKT